MTVGELVELIVDGDNTTSDAELKLVGGPDRVPRRLRALAFNDINLNRSEGQPIVRHGRCDSRRRKANGRWRSSDVPSDSTMMPVAFATFESLNKHFISPPRYG